MQALAPDLFSTAVAPEKESVKNICRSPFETFAHFRTSLLPRFLGQWSGQPPPAEAEVCKC